VPPQDCEHSELVAHYKKVESKHLQLLSDLQEEYQRPLKRMRTAIEELVNIVNTQEDNNINELRTFAEDLQEELASTAEANTERTSELRKQLKDEKLRLKAEMHALHEEAKRDKEALQVQMHAQKEQLKLWML
jgi:hypothetical protein